MRDVLQRWRRSAAVRRWAGWWWEAANAGCDQQKAPRVSWLWNQLNYSSLSGCPAVHQQSPPHRAAESELQTGKQVCVALTWSNDWLHSKFFLYFFQNRFYFWHQVFSSTSLCSNQREQVTCYSWVFEKFLTFWAAVSHALNLSSTHKRSSIISLPFLHPSSSPLSISRYRGLSGNQGRNRSCRKAGMHVVESRRAQYSSLPRISLCNQHVWSAFVPQQRNLTPHFQTLLQAHDLSGKDANSEKNGGSHPHGAS